MVSYLNLGAKWGPWSGMRRGGATCGGHFLGASAECGDDSASNSPAGTKAVSRFACHRTPYKVCPPARCAGADRGYAPPPRQRGSPPRESIVLASILAPLQGAL